MLFGLSTIAKHKRLQQGPSDAQKEYVTEVFTAKTVKVIDGDTIELGSGDRLRLIGINTPERGEQGYQEATDFLTDLVLDAEITYTHDQNKTDRYGRLLGYVYVDGVFVNQRLVEEGLAFSVWYEPDTSKQQLLDQAQIYAQKERKGLWNNAI